MKTITSLICTYKGKEGTYHLVTGKRIHVGMTKTEIKRQTPDSEVFRLTEQGQKTKGIPDGAPVTVELNVIDLHGTDAGASFATGTSHRRHRGRRFSHRRPK